MREPSPYDGKTCNRCRKCRAQEQDSHQITCGLKSSIMRVIKVSGCRACELSAGACYWRAGIVYSSQGRCSPGTRWRSWSGFQVTRSSIFLGRMGEVGLGGRTLAEPSRWCQQYSVPLPHCWIVFALCVFLWLAVKPVDLRGQCLNGTGPLFF